MTGKVQFRGRRASTGLSAIELALLLPLLLILLLGVMDFSRAILFNNILVTMSREGANLASRTTQSPQFIIDALNHTSSPVEMESHGMVYIAQVKGVDGGSGTVVARVEAQYHAINGDMALGSKFWSCPGWTSGGSCSMPAATSDRMVILPFPLALGGEVYVVETLYDYAPLLNFVMKSDPTLYSKTLL